MPKKNPCGALPESVFSFAKTQYHTEPEFPWANTPDAAVFRHENGKWYALMMHISKRKLGLPSDEICGVLNLKCDPMMLGSMLMQQGFFPAYHMNKNSWLTVLLDGSVPEDQVFSAIRMSYALIAAKAGKKHRTAPKAWLIPANPKFENIAESFRKDPEIFWKQSGAFIVGDTVYIYEGKPIGAVTFCCTVTEINIPCHYHQNGLDMDTVMRLQLCGTFSQNQFPLDRLRDFGVSAIRGPRGIPDELLAAMEAGLSRCEGAHK